MLASLTWQDAGKLVIDGKAAFNVMGDWQDGYFSGTTKGGNLEEEAGQGLRVGRGSRHGRRLRLALRQLHLPEGRAARGRREAVARLPRLAKAQDTFNPVKGSIPARKDANKPSVRPVPASGRSTEWKKDKLVGSLTHGVVANNAWNTEIDSALGLFLQSKDTTAVPEGAGRGARQEP